MFHPVAPKGDATSGSGYRPSIASSESAMSTETAPAPAQDAAAEATPEMSAALTMTEVAASKVNEIREAEAIEAHYALRVKVLGGGCAGFQYDLYFDEQAADDMEFESAGVKLIADQMSYMYLMGTNIDYVEGLQGAGFKFNNPMSTGSCGCGSSFSV